MPAYICSIIIPVYNQWEFTRSCLKSLAETLRGEPCEIIVVDNASEDVTPRGCPFLGRQLFGDDFKYLRNEKNINFGPASNAGARAASGGYLIFLNNDTVATPGWLAALHEDFAAIPNLGATGPLLVYPARGPFGHIVQHLGIYVSPVRKVGHLYEGIPAQSPLAMKRRFFQAITAACMMMPRNIFEDLGGFDERYANGFEDVDLCARLGAAGHKLTVNPQSLVVHFQGQTQGRHDAEHINSRLFEAGAQKLLKPDWHKFVSADGYEPVINSWLKIQAMVKGECGISDEASRRELIEAVISEPLWQDGWRRLAQSAPTLEERLWLDASWFRLFFNPAGPEDACRAAIAADDRKQALIWFNTMAYYNHSTEQYECLCNENARGCAANGLMDMAQKYEAWLQNLDVWRRETYAGYIASFMELAKNMLEKGYIKTKKR